VFDTLESEHEIAFDGLSITADGGTYTVEAPGIHEADCSATDLETALENARAAVTNWYFWERLVEGHDTPRRAFLRWCEGAPLELEGHDGHGSAVDDRYETLRKGVVRHWGQLELTTRLSPAVDGHGQGQRVYDIRHVEDADRDRGDLEQYSEPTDARELVTHDADGRYRPLKTAPTLVTGWHFEGLSSTAFVETVRAIYPATIANWHREQHDALDIDHWLETAERQTGIYDIVDELPREAVEWVAEACCVDSQCLKRREWQYEEGDELAVDGGDGVFPCREPCSLVTAAARKWTVLESEDDKTWHLELTTSELNQLTEIIDAVADGRTDEIREADVYDGANRYRARYLRAKRMDGETFAGAHEVTDHEGHAEHAHEGHADGEDHTEEGHDHD